MNYLTKKTSRIEYFKRKISFWMLFAAGLILSACSKDNDSKPDGNDPAIVLDCDYFKDNTNIHLKDNPNAPVDYIIGCDPKIEGDFTVDAGVVVDFEKDAGLQLGNNKNIKIQMNGTADKPIILTGMQKDKGSWRGIQIASDNTANQMNYVTVEYAGQTGRGGWGQKGSVIGVAGGVMKMDHCTIQHGAIYGLHWVDGALNAGELVLSNSTFTGNDIPVHTSVNHINSIDGTSTYTGNVNNYVELRGDDVYQDVTFHKLDVPFLSVGFKPDNKEKRNITFEPGVTLLMEAGSQIHFNNAFHNDHEIIMKGTAEEPITLRGKEEVAGYWNGIQINNTTNPLNE